jgi:hypothetical protein
MRYAKWISALLFVLPTIAAAQMPAANRLVADVPFTFVVADRVMPMGQCIVQRADGITQALLVRSPAAREDAFVIAKASDQKEAATAYSLVFHKYGRRYFLTGVKLEGSQTVYSFKPSKFEEELLAQGAPATEEILLASLK